MRTDFLAGNDAKVCAAPNRLVGSLLLFSLVLSVWLFPSFSANEGSSQRASLFRYQPAGYSPQPNIITPPIGTTPLTQWVPSGSASDAIYYSFYAGAPAELLSMCMAGGGPIAGCVPTIDFTDNVPLIPPQCAGAGADPRFWVAPSPAPCSMYVQGWTGVTDDPVLGPGNYWSMLNAWDQGTGCPGPVPPAPPVPGCAATGLAAGALGFLPGPTIRWGQSAATSNLDLLVAGHSAVESNILNEVYDKMLGVNPYATSQVIGWMVNSYSFLTPGTVQCPAVYVPPGGVPTAVAGCLKMLLRGDISWHDIYGCSPSDSVCLSSHVVTPNDVKFSFLNLPLPPSIAANLIDVVYNVNQLPSAAYSPWLGANGSGVSETFSLYFSALPATLLSDLAQVPIIPEHLWVDPVDPMIGGVFRPCIIIGDPGCFVNPAFLVPGFDPVVAGIFVGSGPYVCASGPLGAVGTVIGAGCTSSGTQAIPVAGAALLRRFSSGANTLNPILSYFRTNAKFQQFQWSAYAISTNSVGVQATTADLISAINSCKANAAAIGGVNAYVACQHWNSPDALLDSYATPGVAIGSASGGRNNCSPVSGCPIGTLVQIAQWVGRAAWCFGAPSNLCSSLAETQAMPQTLYEDASSEGDFTVTANPNPIPSPCPASSLITVSLSGGPDNYMGGTAAPYAVGLTTVFSAPILGTAITPLSNTLSPSTPSGTATLTVLGAGTGTVIVRAAITIPAQVFAVYRTVTITAC